MRVDPPDPNKKKIISHQPDAASGKKVPIPPPPSDEELGIASGGISHFPVWNGKVRPLSNERLIQSLNLARQRNESASIENDRLARNEADRIIANIHPTNFGYAEDAAGYLIKLFHNAGLDFYDEISRSYDEERYISGSDIDCFMNASTAVFMLTENEDIDNFTIYQRDMDLPTTTELLNKLTSYERRLLIYSLSFDPIVDGEGIEVFFDSLQRICDYSVDDGDDYSILHDDAVDFRDGPTGSIFVETNADVSAGIVDVEGVFYYDSDLGEFVADEAEFSGGDYVVDVIADLEKDLYKQVINIAGWRRVDETSVADDVELVSTDTMTINPEDAFDPANLDLDSEISYEIRRQEVLVCGIQKELFSYSADNLIELYRAAITEECREKIFDKLNEEIKAVKNKDNSKCLELKEKIGAILVEEVENKKALPFDDGFRRYYSVLRLRRLHSHQEDLDKPLNKMVDFLISPNPLVKVAAVDSLLTGERFGKKGLDKLIDAIKVESKDKARESTLLGILCRSIKLDAEYEYRGGASFDLSFEALLSDPEFEVDAAFSKLDGPTEEASNLDVEMGDGQYELRMKEEKRQEALKGTSIPYNDKTDEFQLESSPRIERDFLEYVSVGRLVRLITQRDNETLRKNAQELLSRFPLRDIQLYLVEMGDSSEAKLLLEALNSQTTTPPGEVLLDESLESFMRLIRTRPGIDPTLLQ